jgi:hypothetical protein
LSTLRIESSARTRGRRVADAIYGTILVLAVVGALSRDAEATVGAILGGALATSVVFWIVHVYAEVLDLEVSGESPGGWAAVRAAAWQEFPLVQAALLPMVPLVLGTVGVLGRSAAVNLSLAIGFFALAAWGYHAGRTMQQSRLRAGLQAAGAAGLGLLMVLLKNLVH